MSEWVSLQCGSSVVHVERSLCVQAGDRVHWKSFTTEREEPPALTVTRRRGLQADSLEAPLGRCSYRLEESQLEFDVGDGIAPAELVLRLAYYVCGMRQGAVLMHGCALVDDGRAVVASGQSGNGKSTLSRLGVDAGLQLLTDEVVMLFPDGTVSGTPFRSDYLHPGQPGRFPVKYFFALKKTPHEALTPLSSVAAVQLALSQCFQVPELALPQSDVRARVLGFLSQVTPRTLEFRKDPAAGLFVRASLR